MDEGKKASSELVVAGGDSAELLELEEEGFHKMAFFVEPPIDEPRVGVIRLGRDAEIRIVVGDKLAKLPLAVSPVSKDGRTFEVNLGDQFLGNSDVSGIAGSQQYRNRVAQSVDSSVNLGASATAAHSNALIDLSFCPDRVQLLAGSFYGISGF